MVCRRCGAEVGQEQRRCQGCDVVLRGRRTTLARLALWAGPGALLLVGVGALSLDPNPNDGAAGRAVQYAERSDPAPTTSVVLQRAYDQDPRAADTRFKSRLLKITGTLAAPPRLELSGLTLSLVTGAPAGPIIVETVVGDRARVGKLKAGDEVQLQCVCRGLFAGQVLLNACRLQGAAGS